MFFSWISSFIAPKEEVQLPQKDRGNKEKRANKVAQACKRYEWRYDAIGDAAMIKDLPFPEELPQLGWVAALSPILLRIALNSGGTALDEAIETTIIGRIGALIASSTGKILTGQLSTGDISGIMNQIIEIATGNIKGDGTTLQDYKDMFSAIPLDTVAELDQFLLDDMFGWYRVAGPNPMRITKLPGAATEMFPDITDDIFRGINGFNRDSLQAAYTEDRLYYVDYKEFDGLPTGSVNGVKKNAYNFSPKCLLAVPKDDTDRLTVLPVAIYCGQDSSFPMYTANTKHTDPITWIAAKYTVQVSDAVIHEAVYHLGRCHLLMEVFNCSMHRTIPPNHPLQRLLKYSFYGTALINNAAVTALINDGGGVDTITAPDIRTTRQISASAVNDPSFSFNEWMPDKELKNRGVMNSVLDYPYRDDCLEMWEAINKFVKSFIDRYYKSDADVQSDYELQKMCEEVVACGKLHGFGESSDGTIHTRAYLVRMVSMLLFTSSVQHAAVNFTQSTMMQFTPAMSLGAADEAPKTKKPYKSLNEWVNKMVPDFERTEMQLVIAETIGVVRYTQIGEYGKDLDFAGEDVKNALKVFQKDLGRIGARIHTRNEKERKAGLSEYNFLIPKNVPMSVNI